MHEYKFLLFAKYVKYMIILACLLLMAYFAVHSYFGADTVQYYINYYMNNNVAMTFICALILMAPFCLAYDETYKCMLIDKELKSGDYDPEHNLKDVL